MSNNALIKRLLLANANQTITSSELEQLRLLARLYTEEELEELLLQLPIETPTKVSLHEVEANRTAARKAIRVHNRGRWIKIWFWMAAAACVVLIIVRFVPNIWYPRPIDTSNHFTNLYTNDSLFKIIKGSQSGEAIQIQNVDLHPEKGKLRINISPIDSIRTHPYWISLVTTSKQQFQYELAEGVAIRVNANSRWRIPLHGNAVMSLNGQAVIQITTDTNTAIQFPHLLLQAKNARFTVSARSERTEIKMLEGVAEVVTHKSRQKTAVQAGQLVLAGSLITSNAIRDTLILQHQRSTVDPLYWTRQTRRYKNIQLPDYMKDLEQWYGIKLVNANCLPQHLLVNAQLEFDAPLREALQVIENAGVRVYQSGNKLSFCDPKQHGKKPGS